jgi:hypothetical protein
MTLLSAVNTILSVINERPVSTLDGDKTPDVAEAERILDEVNTAVQSQGWAWNSDYEYPLPLGEGDKIRKPDDMLYVEFDPAKLYGTDPVFRGGFLWDRKNLTFEYEQALTAKKIVWLLDYEEAPESFQRYVMVRAARVFAQRKLTSPLIDGFEARHEANAYARLMNDELRAEGTSVANAPSVAPIIQRQMF